MTTALTTVKPDRQEATEFLAALFGHYFSDNDGWVEFRFLPPEKGQKLEFLPAWARQGKLDAGGWKELSRRNQSAHIIFGVNPRTIQKGRAVDIEAIICLWADVDGKDEGKTAAWKRVEEFPIQPSMVVDSGQHGYHCYWLLRRPLLDITEDIRLEVRQILKGLSKSQLKSDPQRTDLSSCLRLPGTMNIKPGMEPKRCSLVYCHPEQTFTLSDFAAYRDSSFKEPEGYDEELPPFGDRNLLVSAESEADALKTVDELQISKRHLTMILTGKGKGLKNESDRSARDMAIIRALVWAGYGYATIKSIFFNPWLKCADRIKEAGEAKLKWDVQKALKWYEQLKIHGTPQSRWILTIKNNPILTPPEKQAKIKEFVVADLLTSPEALGEGFYEDESGPYYFFHNEERSLIDLDSAEFDHFIEGRFVVTQNDFQEFKRALKATIYASKKKVVPRFVHYYDEEKGALYMDNGANGIYRLEGGEIKLLDNGDEGVFFKHEGGLMPFEWKPDVKVVNYFQDEVPDDHKQYSNPLAGVPLGLSLEKFQNSYLDEFLVSRTSFATEEEHHILPEEQKLLLIIYFYSLFFESILTEKPIVAFIGKMASGKSFISTSIGKILFGFRFDRCSFPDTDDNLKTVLGEERYVVFDNVTKISRDLQNTLCNYATGRPKIGKREPYKKTQQKGEPHCFVALTSCEPKGWQQDLMRRVLLFNTQQIRTVIGQDELLAPLMKNRDNLMTEIIENLNSVVAILRQWKDAHPENPPGIIASWMSFGQKVTSWFGSRKKFRAVIAKLAAKKEETLLDEDPLWWVLEYVLFERWSGERDSSDQGCSIEPISTRALFQFLSEEAKEMKLLREFEHWYRSRASLGKRLANIKEELAKRIEVEEIPGRARMKFWGFRRKEETAEAKMEQPVGTDWDELAKATARNFEEPEMTPPDAELLSVPETDEDLVELGRLLEETSPDDPLYLRILQLLGRFKAGT